MGTRSPQHDGVIAQKTTEHVFRRALTSGALELEWRLSTRIFRPCRISLYGCEFSIPSSRWCWEYGCQVLACKLYAFAKRLSIAVAALVFAQFTLGIANIVLLTPIWLQLTHLLTADLLWIACVLLADLQPASASPALPR